MRPPVLDPHRMLAWMRHGHGYVIVRQALRDAVRWGAHHSGLPAILVAAIVVVVSWRLFRRTLRFVVEVAVAVALLAAATSFGWISW